MDNKNQVAEILLSLSPLEVVGLKEGINFFRNKKSGKNYILYKDKNHLRACKNMCKHQGGLFIEDIEDLDGRSVRCTKHNWKLDVSTMKYINPPDSFCQDELGYPGSSCCLKSRYVIFHLSSKIFLYP
ncbi:cytidine monophosphate-N-acetylneuraminic acid hydroxylase-like [Sarcophilus harrisii]